MYLLADEGVERQIVERLRLDGHTVAYITPGNLRIRQRRS